MVYRSRPRSSIEASTCTEAGITVRKFPSSSRPVYNPVSSLSMSSRCADEAVRSALARWPPRCHPVLRSTRLAAARRPEAWTALAAEMLALPGFVVGELPGDLDEAGQLVLARRLVREGVLMRAG